LCFVSYSTEHKRGQAANFIDTSFAKRDLALNALRKVKPIKTTLVNTRFVQITKSIQDLM
jgi:hypothetical protein